MKTNSHITTRLILTVSVAALCAFTFASCQKPVAEDSAPAAPAPVGPATPSPVATPPSLVTAPPASPAPPVLAPPELAPPGRFFLRRKASSETAEGIVGYAPGTPVDQAAPGHYRVQDGNTLVLSDAEVTNNLAEARELVKGDATTRAAIARSLATPAAKAAMTSPPTPAIQAVPAARPGEAPGFGAGPALGGSGAVGETGAAKSSVTWHTDAQGRQYHNGTYGRIYR